MFFKTSAAMPHSPLQVVAPLCSPPAPLSLCLSPIPQGPGGQCLALSPSQPGRAGLWAAPRQKSPPGGDEITHDSGGVHGHGLKCQARACNAPPTNLKGRQPPASVSPQEPSSPRLGAEGLSAGMPRPPGAGRDSAAPPRSWPSQPCLLCCQGQPGTWQAQAATRGFGTSATAWAGSQDSEVASGWLNGERGLNPRTPQRTWPGWPGGAASSCRWRRSVWGPPPARLGWLTIT